MPCGARIHSRACAIPCRRWCPSCDVSWAPLDQCPSRGGGYVVDVPLECVDIHRFESLVQYAVDATADGRHRDALDALSDAESLWIGEPLAEFAYEEFARTAIARLNELHIRATELRVDAELALGHHLDVLADLESAVAEHPLRERLRAQLMLALYRSGRQADALRTFHAGREVLAEELGLDPGPELRELERAILQQDASLDAASPASVVEASRSAPARFRRWDVPAPVADVIGREAELSELAEAIAKQRLVTLIGPGGVGKTRLALEVARRVGAGLTSGAVMVELAPVVDDSGVRHALASAMRIQDVDGLTDLLATAELLVVLDNCEHMLVTSAALAEELLGRCPGLRVLATSREALRVAGEHVVDVAPLAVDDAVELFVGRSAAAGGPDIAAATIDTVAEICRRLDGLPLAIELAAARTRAFPLDHLAERLDDRFRLLTAGSRTSLPRQQTLRAVVDWSYDLLFDDQQRFLERLSVFPGGFTIESAQAVSADESGVVDDVEEIVETLLEKSLLRTTWTDHGVRFSQLQTLLEYGRDRLADRADCEEIHRRMREYFASLSARSPEAYRGQDQAGWIATVTAEHDNLRAALEQAVAIGDAETALAITGGVGWYQWLGGLIGEGGQWVEHTLSCTGATSPRTRALALMNRGYHEFLGASFVIDEPAGGPRGDVDASFGEATEILRRSGDDATLGLIVGFWAELALARGDVDLARELRTQELEIYAARDDEWSRAAADHARAVLELLGEGSAVIAEQHYRSAARGFETCGSSVMVALCRIALADFAEARDDVATAVTLLESAVDINRSLHLAGVTAVALSRLGNVLVAADQLDRAAPVVDEALELGERLASVPVRAAALSSHARLALRRGDLDDAEQSAAAALELVRPSRRPDSGRVRPAWAVPAGPPALLSVLGSVALGRGEIGRAIDLHREAVAAAIRTQDVRVMAAAARELAASMNASGDTATASQLTTWAAAGSGDPDGFAMPESTEQLAVLAAVDIDA